MIFSSFFKALGQLGDPRFRKVLFLGIGLTFVLLIAAYAGLLGVIEWLTGETTSLPIVGEVTWVGDLLSFGSLFHFHADCHYDLNYSCQRDSTSRRFSSIIFALR